MKKNFHVGIAAASMVLPKNCYSNDDIIAEIKKATVAREDIPELNSQWIEENIWIKQRYHFSEDETLVEVSVQVVEKALKQAGWDPQDLDFVIFSSVSPHCERDGSVIPSTACLIQEKLKAYNAMAYNTSAACSGWVYGVGQAVAFIESGMARRGVVICTEKQRVGLDFSNHRSSILIGDIATATLVENTETTKTKSVYLRANDAKELSGIISLPYYNLERDDSHANGFFDLKGRAVFKEGIAVMTRLTEEALVMNELTKDDVDWFVYHQANGAMLRLVGRNIGFADEKNLMTIQEFANTTAGTIPSVLAKYTADGTIKRGDILCCVAFGGGLTSGSIVFEY